jgi:1,4-alpha-glucan branching enzyme
MTSVSEDGTVTFKFYRPEAADVKIVGDFTGWNAAPIEMTSAGDGWWTLGQLLSGGEYRFRYLADGQMFPDYASYGIEATKTGWNSVVVVPGCSKKQSKQYNAKWVA